jgi:hypothetical protein
MKTSKAKKAPAPSETGHMTVRVTDPKDRERIRKAVESFAKRVRVPVTLSQWLYRVAMDAVEQEEALAKDAPKDK